MTRQALRLALLAFHTVIYVSHARCAARDTMLDPAGEELVTRHLYYLAPLGAWAASIFALSSLPQSTIVRTSSSVERATLSFMTDPAFVHAVEFGVLAALGYRVLTAYTRLAGPYLWLATLVVAITYGALDEVHQSFVPGRYATLEDMGFDSLGALVGLALTVGAARLWRLAKGRDGTGGSPMSRSTGHHEA